jgi:transcriptional repressor NrdR
MRCPTCQGRTEVYDTRLNREGLVRRRRSCPGCAARFATIEILNLEQPLGKRESPEPREPRPKLPRPERPQAKPKETPAPRPKRIVRDEWEEPEEDLMAYFGFDRKGPADD